MKHPALTLFLITIFTFAVAVLFFPLSLEAEVNLEQFSYLDQKTGFHGLLNMMFSLNKGKTDSLMLNASGGLGYRKGSNHLLFIGNVGYGESYGMSFLDQNFLHFRFARVLNKTFSLETFLHRKSDKIKYLKSKTYAGGGVRVSFTSTDHMAKEKKKATPPPLEISCGFGLLYEWERFEKPEGIAVNDDTDLLKSIGYLSIEWRIKPTFTVMSMTSFSFAFKEFRNNDLYWDVSLNSAIGKHISLMVQFKYAHDNDTALTVDEDDYQLSCGASWKF